MKSTKCRDQHYYSNHYINESTTAALAFSKPASRAQLPNSLQQIPIFYLTLYTISLVTLPLPQLLMALLLLVLLPGIGIGIGRKEVVIHWMVHLLLVFTYRQAP